MTNGLPLNISWTTKARHSLHSVLTQRVFRSKFMQTPELIVTIQDRGTSHYGHQDHIRCIEFSFLISISTRSVGAPSPTRTRVAVSAGARAIPWYLISTLGVDVDRLQIVCRLEHHAQRQRDHGHDHLPGVRGAELAVRPKELSRHIEWSRLNSSLVKTELRGAIWKRRTDGSTGIIKSWPRRQLNVSLRQGCAIRGG